MKILYKNKKNKKKMSNFLQLQTQGTFDTLNEDYVRNSIFFKKKILGTNNRCCSRGVVVE